MFPGTRLMNIVLTYGHCPQSTGCQSEIDALSSRVARSPWPRPNVFFSTATLRDIAELAERLPGGGIPPP